MNQHPRNARNVTRVQFLEFTDSMSRQPISRFQGFLVSDFSFVRRRKLSSYYPNFELLFRQMRPNRLVTDIA